MKLDGFVKLVDGGTVNLYSKDLVDTPALPQGSNSQNNDRAFLHCWAHMSCQCPAFSMS